MKIAIHELPSGGEVLDPAALEQFQRNWATYQKLVESDALSHREVGEILHAALDAIGQPFSFVDFACGDAQETAHVLRRTRVERYRGIDMSEPALELAAMNLDGASFEVELDHGDFVEALAKAAPTDVAWCSLSIHHLHTDEKRAFLKTVRAHTRRFFMIYEPTRLEGESHDAFMTRFMRDAKAKWSMLTPDEWSQIARHVESCDLPEMESVWLDIGREAGFARATALFTDPDKFFRLIRYDCN